MIFRDSIRPEVRSTTVSLFQWSISNNRRAGQDGPTGREGERRKGEQANALFLLRRGGGVRLRCALPTLFNLINITQQLSQLQINKMTWFLMTI